MSTPRKRSYRTSIKTTVWFGDSADAVSTQLTPIVSWSKRGGEKPVTFDITRADEGLEDDDTQPYMRNVKGVGKSDSEDVEFMMPDTDDVLAQLVALKGLEKFFEVRFPSGGKQPFLATLGYATAPKEKEETVNTVTLYVLDWGDPIPAA